MSALTQQLNTAQQAAKIHKAKHFV